MVCAGLSSPHSATGRREGDDGIYRRVTHSLMQEIENLGRMKEVWGYERTYIYTYGSYFCRVWVGFIKWAHLIVEGRYIEYRSD